MESSKSKLFTCIPRNQRFCKHKHNRNKKYIQKRNTNKRMKQKIPQTKKFLNPQARYKYQDAKNAKYDKKKITYKSYLQHDRKKSDHFQDEYTQKSKSHNKTNYKYQNGYHNNIPQNVQKADKQKDSHLLINIRYV